MGLNTNDVDVNLHITAYGEDIAEDIENLKADVKEIKSTSQYDWFFNNATKQAPAMVQRMVNTAIANKMLIAKEISLLQSGDKFQHDATIRYYQNDLQLYCTYVNNKVDKSDSAYGQNAYVRLTRLNGGADGTVSIVENIDICKYGDTIDGLTVTSGCGVPNSIIKGDTLYMYWSCSLSDGNWYECYCTYDCVNHAVITKGRCLMGDGYFSCSAIAQQAGYTTNTQISMNADIAELNGTYYACICSNDTWKDGILIKSTDLITWEFLCVPQWLNGLTSNAIYEGAMLGWRNNLYLALRQKTNSKSDTTPLIFARLDAAGQVLENVCVPSISSRPSFFKRGTNYAYLVFPTNFREKTVCINIYSDGKLTDSLPVMDIATGGNYVQIEQRTQGLQFVVRTQGTTGLRVSSMNGVKRDVAEALTDFCTALGY